MVNNLKTQGSFIPSNNTGSSMNDKLARLGRHGDTEIRNVDGRPSHVNAWEAYLIDNYGPTGEEITKDIGSGTLNPATGMREYAPRWLAKTRRWAKRQGRGGRGSFTTLGKKIGAVLNTQVWQPITGSGHTKWFTKEKSKHASDSDRYRADAELAMDRWKKSFGARLIAGLTERRDKFQSIDAKIRENLDRINKKFEVSGHKYGGFGNISSGSAAAIKRREMRAIEDSGIDLKEAENVQARLKQDEFLGEQRAQWKSIIDTHDTQQENLGTWYNDSWDRDGGSGYWSDLPYKEIDDYFKDTAYEIKR